VALRPRTFVALSPYDSVSALGNAMVELDEEVALLASLVHGHALALHLPHLPGLGHSLRHRKAQSKAHCQDFKPNVSKENRAEKEQTRK